MSSVISAFPRPKRPLTARRSEEKPEAGQRAASIWRRVYFLVAAALMIASVGIPSGANSRKDSARVAAEAAPDSTILAQYAVSPLHPSHQRNARAVEKAVGFLLTLQPEGTYILTAAGMDDVVHMDVAHAAIALSKVGYLAEAEAAMNWMVSTMTLKGASDQYGDMELAGETVSVDYSGSWHDHYRTSGEPRRDLTRGRGEGVGMGLIAIYTIYQQDPSYLQMVIQGATVGDRVAAAVGYLTSETMQHPDGRFNHRPDYRVSFGEEAARMSLGLELGARMLDEMGDRVAAQRARWGAERGLSALRGGDGLSYGMAYDYYAMSIWGLATQEQAQEELSRLEAAGLVTPDGVRNWDWQLLRAEDWRDKLRWWAASQSIGPSQTFDWAIASIAAGNMNDALEIERRWLPLQRSDGSFAGLYFLGLRVGAGPSNSYAAARFILMERLLMQALSPGVSPHDQPALPDSA